MRLADFQLNDRQLEKLSDISSDLGLVSAASIVLPAVFDRFNSMLLIFGAIASFSFWIISLALRR